MIGDSKYDDVLVLEFFKCSVQNYKRWYVEEALFAPLLKRLSDDEALAEIRNQLAPCSKSRRKKANVPDYEEDLLEDYCRAIWRNSKMNERFRQWLIDHADGLIATMRDEAADAPILQRIEEVRNTFRLNEDEIKVVLFMWLLNTDRLRPTARCDSQIANFIGLTNLYTNIPKPTLSQIFGQSSRLCRFGIIAERERTSLRRQLIYFLEGYGEEALTSLYYRKDSDETLPMSFFGDLAKRHVPILRQLLSSPRPRGLNILLYGAPGTGKTSFARALAKEVGRTCYQVVQRPRNRSGDYTAASAEMRYAAIEICDEQTPSESSMIIVDEADALLRCQNMGLLAMFGSSSALTGDKGLLNDILEKNTTPIIWITNTSADELDPSNRRRFDYSICFKSLTKEQRVGIWRNAARQAGVPTLLTKSEIVHYIDRYRVNTGIIARAFENVAALEAPRATRKKMLETLLSQHCELSGEETKEPTLPAVTADYSLDALNIRSRIPLDKVIASARRFLNSKIMKDDRDAPRFNILLTGVPGSGKTEFVKYLASQLGCPLCVRRASDLKSKWVGETEKNIAAAFREAKARRAILFFDEVDTFLDNRESLSQGHEKSMVNEVLQQMENFGGIFVGTTNFAKMLDPAVARRFTFKIELDYLTDGGKQLFFKRFFNAVLTADEEARLNAVEHLTPGDFRTVRQELYYLGDDVGNDDRLSALEEEVRAKSVGQAAHIGF